MRDTYRRKEKEINDHSSRVTGCAAFDNIRKIKTPFTTVLEVVDVEKDIEFDEEILWV